MSLNTTVFWKIIFQKFAIQKKFTLSLKRQKEMINEKTKQNNKRFCPSIVQRSLSKNKLVRVGKDLFALGKSLCGC